MKDTKLQQVAGPALTKLLERGDLDAMINISSLNLAAEAQKDKFLVLFLPNDFWIKKTGFPIVWAAPLVAWKSWVDEDQTRAKNFSAAAAASFEMAGEAGKPGSSGEEPRRAGRSDQARRCCRVQRLGLAHKHMFMTRWDNHRGRAMAIPRTRPAHRHHPKVPAYRANMRCSCKAVSSRQ